MGLILTEQEYEERAKGLGLFIHLPREVRHMIYKQMIAQGSVNIIQASSLIKEETSALAFEHGVCRLNFNFYNTFTEELVPCFNPSQDIANKIRKLVIRVDTRRNGYGDYPTPDVRVLNKFRGSDIQRKTCTVSFVCWPTTGKKIQWDVLAVLEAYTGFEEMKVTVECDDWSEQAWAKKKADFSLEQFVTFSSVENSYDKIRTALSPTLGHGDGGLWNKDYFTVLTFRP